VTYIYRYNCLHCLYEEEFWGKIEREEEEKKLHNARKSRIDFSSYGVAVAAASFSSSLSFLEKKIVKFQTC